MTRGVADAASDRGGFDGETVPFEAKRDQTVVVRPNGAVLIGIGIVATVLAREGADAAAGIHIRCHQPRDALGRAIRGDDARPQQMPLVGGNGWDGLFLAVQEIRVKAKIFVPEYVVE